MAMRRQRLWRHGAGAPPSFRSTHRTKRASRVVGKSSRCLYGRHTHSHTPTPLGPPARQPQRTMPLTSAQAAAHKRVKLFEEEFASFLDAQIKVGADPRCINTAKTHLQAARLFANEGICGPLAKYMPEPKEEEALAPATADAVAVAAATTEKSE